MTPIGRLDLIPLRDINALVRGARIDHVLVNLKDDQPLLVIVTDRIHPDTGQVLSIHIEGAQSIGVAASILHAIPGEAPRP